MPTPPLPQELMHLVHAIRDAGGQAVLVGGAVRDYCLGKEFPRDLDIEIFNLEASNLEALLEKAGKVHRVGKQFGIFKLATDEGEYDFSLPRVERKIGPGHRGFEVQTDSRLNFAQASYRRDFTINSIGLEILKEQWLDPFGGMPDLQRKTLRHIGRAFGEDPLRVLRGVQFSARFEFRIAQETVRVCRNLRLDELPRERIFPEFRKMLLADRPSIGLEATRELNVLAHFPELESLIGVPQDPVWHPEGDVWTHTLRVVDEAARLKTGEPGADLHLMFAALCHDLGKPQTTSWESGHWRSHGHDTAGTTGTTRFLKRLTGDKELIREVSLLVRDHLRPQQLYQKKKEVRLSAIRRLALRVNIPKLVRLAKADYLGMFDPRTYSRKFPAGDWLMKQAKMLAVEHTSPIPVLRGRDLLVLGMQPGPKMGLMLKEAFELQLEGKINNREEAAEWARNRLGDMEINLPAFPD